MKNCNKLQILGVILLLIFSSCFIYAEEKFEKGDAIYTDMGGGLNPFWFLGHAGLYYYWDSTENEVSHVAEPENYEKHFIIQSADNGVQGFGKNKITFQKFYDDGKFWGVKTTKLSYLQRKKIIQIAKSKKGNPYAFFKGYKGSVKKDRLDTFRCDGLVEYCYERAGVGYFYDGKWVEGIVDDKSWRSLTPKKQMNCLADPARFEQYAPQFTDLVFDNPAIYIDEEPLWPDEHDGYYHVNKNCEVRVFAADECGSGIGRFELWLGEPDDTPEKQGEDDNTGIRLDKNNDKHELCSWNNFDWDISDVEPGEYELYAKAFDQAGNTKETYINVKIEEPPYYFHVQLSPEYVETGSPESQTQTFTITVQCYKYGTGELLVEEGKKYVNKKAGTESWWKWVREENGVMKSTWEKEKHNDNCIAPEEWTKSDYAREVSFGIANITNSAYELYAGGKKLEKITLADGTGSISAVIKAEDGNIGDNHLFLIISASDGTGSGNGALMVNPVEILPTKYASRRDYDWETLSWEAWENFSLNDVYGGSCYEYSDYEYRGLMGYYVSEAYTKLFVVQPIGGTCQICSQAYVRKPVEFPPADVPYEMTRHIGYYNTMPVNGGELNNSFFGSWSFAFPLSNYWCAYYYSACSGGQDYKNIFITPLVDSSFYIGIYFDPLIKDFWASTFAGEFAWESCQSFVRADLRVFYIPKSDK